MIFLNFVTPNNEELYVLFKLSNTGVDTKSGEVFNSISEVKAKYPEAEYACQVNGTQEELEMWKKIQRDQEVFNESNLLSTIEIKCSNCNYCIIETDDLGCAKARCKLTCPPKRGKVLTRANTTYLSPQDILTKNVYQHGKDRVNEKLKNKKSAPSWCPINKKNI